MSVDILQEKIRKTKNPSLVELALSTAELPPEFSPDASGYGAFCIRLLDGLKGLVPGVRVSFASFALLGADGLNVLSQVLAHGKAAGFYMLLDAPEIWSVPGAQSVADGLFGDGSIYPCDGLVVSGYLGSDCIKPFLPYCRDTGKDIFVAVRTANKSAPELQDLLSGARLVHMVAADYVNRYGAEMVGKSGYSRVSALAAASSADSLRNLRSKYSKLFLLLDGYDYPNSNAKNCSLAFDRLGHGAAACGGRSITCAWNDPEGPCEDWLPACLAAAQRMKKNLTKYLTIL